MSQSAQKFGQAVGGILGIVHNQNAKSAGGACGFAGFMLSCRGVSGRFNNRQTDDKFASLAWTLTPR